MARLFPFSAPRVVTQTFTANAVFRVSGVTVLTSMSGYGAKGDPGTTYTVIEYYQEIIRTLVKRSGGTTTQVAGRSYHIPGSYPADYCDASVSTPTNSTYSSFQDCYYFSDTSYDEVENVTTGAASTGVGKTFPGSRGAASQTVTTFTNVAIQPNTDYQIVVPAGGYITIVYTQP